MKDGLDHLIREDELDRVEGTDAVTCPDCGQVRRLQDSADWPILFWCGVCDQADTGLLDARDIQLDYGERWSVGESGALLVHTLREVEDEQ